jgi:penicillin amidase
MRRLWRIVKRVLLVVLVLFLVLVVALGSVFTWLVVRGFPQREGSIQLPGLTAPVHVVRDASGIVNIYAATTEDLFAAQGYIHASERMWQMEVWRRIGAGRLSELFGDDSLDNDKFIRLLGWRRAAEADWAIMSDEGRLALESYARGVNAWLDQHGDLPLPFVIAGLQGAGGGLSGFRPEPWTPIDTLSWQKVQAWALGDNFGTELLRMILLKRGLSTQQIAELAPAYDPSRPVVVPSDTESGQGTPPRGRPTTTGMDAATATLLLKASDFLRSTIAMAGAGAALAGSNGIAVAPSRSASGGALLANDPHLDISMPSVWFLVGLHCEPAGPQCPYELAGAGFPGVPGIVLGHNARIGWGLTNVGPDVQDVFEETVDPADETRYLYKGQSLPFEYRHESIGLSNGETVHEVTRSTVHGPVISDLQSDFRSAEDGGADLGRDGYVYALQWTATMEADRTLDAVLGVNRAQNWEEFRTALRGFEAPSQAFLYADVDGHIGIQIPGRFPIRANGDGSYPVSGESGNNDWIGFVPFDELPSVYDPTDGLIVTANNQPTDPGAGPYIGRDFDPGFRAARIHELLDGSDSITADQLRSVQGDVKLTRAAPVLEALTDVQADGTASDLRRQLLDWRDDLSCSTGSVGCAAYETFEYWLLRGVFDDELGDGYEPDNASWRYVGSEPSHDMIGRLVSQPNSPWWDDQSTAPLESREVIIGAALERAASDLATLGAPDSRTWGRIHTVTFQEQTLGTAGIGPLEWIFNKGPFPAPGSCTTVNKVCGRIADDWPMEGDKPDLQARFAASSSPSYRLVVDMSNLDGATIIQATGQSGLPFDSHYGDYIARWLTNSPIPLPWTKDAVEAAQVQVLTLTR